MKKLRTLLFISTIAIGSFAIVSCEKEDPKKDIDTQAAVDNEQAEAVSDDAMRKADAATKGQSSFRIAGDASYREMLACATVTHVTDSVSNQTTVTIDFGTSNCTGMDGRLRRGKIVYKYSGNYFAAGSVRNLTFDNYFVDDCKIEGDHTVTFLGMDSTTQHYSWNVRALNMKITKADGKSHTWESTRQRVMLEGDTSIFNFSDDVYQITGTASGTNVNNVAYSVNIDSPFKVANSCRYIMSGKATLKVSGVADRIIDFGNGACDDAAIVTINGIPYAIKLH
jgi:hypothetical protein